MDNLKQKFKDSLKEVRKRTLSIVGEKDPTFELFKGEEDSYKRGILLCSRKLAGSFQKEERIDAIAKIGHLSWTGGPRATKCGGEYLVNLIGILSHDAETPDVKLVVLKTLSEICYMCPSTQDKARQFGLPELLGTMLDQRSIESIETRRWASYTLMQLVIGNYQNQMVALAIPTLKDSLKRISREKWRGWESNEAAELIIYLGID